MIDVISMRKNDKGAINTANRGMSRPLLKFVGGSGEILRDVRL